MAFTLRAHDRPGIQALLRDLGVLGVDQTIGAVDVAGAGNMNITLRVATTDGSVIVKHAPPYVARFPSIEAPEERAEVEAAFYLAVQAHPAVAARMPSLLARDPLRHVLVLDDLGPARDYADLYGDAVLQPAHLDALLGWLDALAALPPDTLGPTLQNRAMRALNHAHIFEIPFATDAGLDLDAVLPGLDALAAPLRGDTAVARAAAALGQRYLADGGVLLHGDFYPGSWLRTEPGPMVIDPEFGFVGDPAFDRGVLVAHLALAEQPSALLERALDGAPEGSLAFAGVEVLRRLLGVAQLPITLPLSRRAALVDLGSRWLLDGAP